MKYRQCTLLLPMAVLLLAGCGWHRTVVNEKVLSLETDWIRPGQTTWVEVLEKLGPPQDAATPQQILRAQAKQNVLKYVCYDVKRTSLLLSYYLSLPFHWSDQQKRRELVVEFDSNGKVIGVYDSHATAIWRPLADEEDRPPSTFDIRGP